MIYVHNTKNLRKNALRMGESLQIGRRNTGECMIYNADPHTVYDRSRMDNVGGLSRGNL